MLLTADLFGLHTALERYVSNPFVYLLVREHRAALEWSQMAAEQGSARLVVFTEDSIVDVMEAIPRHQSVSTSGTAETLQESEHRTAVRNNGLASLKELIFS